MRTKTVHRENVAFPEKKKQKTKNERTILGERKLGNGTALRRGERGGEKKKRLASPVRILRWFSGISSILCSLVGLPPHRDCSAPPTTSRSSWPLIFNQRVVVIKKSPGRYHHYSTGVEPRNLSPEEAFPQDTLRTVTDPLPRALLPIW